MPSSLNEIVPSATIQGWHQPAHDSREQRQGLLALASGVIGGLVSGAIVGVAFRMWPAELRSFWSAAPPIIEAAATIVIGYYTRTLYVSTRRIQEASDETLGHLRREFEAEHRPWLSIAVEAKDPLKIMEGGGNTVLTYIFTNIGRVPALKTRVAHSIIPPGVDPVEAQRRIADEDLAEPHHGSAADGHSVFPGPPATFRLPRTINAATVRAWTEWWETSDAVERATKPPHVVGCVSYGSPLDPGKRYQTGFIRELHAHELTEFGKLKPVDPCGTQTYSAIFTAGSQLGSGAIT